ncbi:MAG: acyltransferase [Flavobacteriaceae bacterium]|nr:acyltransferase [Flavobacteriaceae bacterium]
MSIQNRRVFGLDLMRAIAILMVLFSHVLIVFFKSNNVVTNVFGFIGLHGVEVFFALSGFLIGTILLKTMSQEGFSAKQVLNFWTRRWFRTLPLYFLILLLNIILFYYIKNDFPEKIGLFPFFAQNLITNHPFFFPEAWSLSVEEYAYLFSPIILWFCYKIFKAKQKSFLLSTLLLISVCILTKAFFYLKHVTEPLSIGYWDNSLKEVVIYRLDAIYYGFIIAYGHFYYINWLKNRRHKLLIFGSVLLVINHMLFMMSSTQEEHSFYIDVLFLPLNSITICMFLPYLYYLKCSFRLIENIIYKISIYSYSIYLLHYTFILGLMTLILPFERFTLLQRIGYVFVYLVITYVLSYVIYKYFETPLTNLRDSNRVKNLFKMK